jgi:hypothetical protein
MRENLAGVDVVSVGPLFAKLTPGGVQYSVVAIVPDRSGKDFVPSWKSSCERDGAQSQAPPRQHEGVNHALGRDRRLGRALQLGIEEGDIEACVVRH